MSESGPLSMSGGCLCGAVRYEARLDSAEGYYCHCRMCQLAFGNTRAAYINLRKSEVRWLTPPQYFVSSKIARRGFCGHCGTPLSFEFNDSERMDLSEEKVRGILKIAKQPVSMETPVGDDGDATLGDMIEDSAASSPADAAMQADLRAAIDDALDSLSPREAKVLRMRYGINTKSDHTLEEVGKQFDVTRERIRQIESKAMRKLMHPSRADRLKSFLDR